MLCTIAAVWDDGRRAKRVATDVSLIRGGFGGCTVSTVIAQFGDLFDGELLDQVANVFLLQVVETMLP
jgi:hypothetical protein